MSDFDIWVDFNSTDSQDFIVTLRKYGPDDMWIGSELMAGDHDGNLCPAQVTDLSDNLVELKLDLARFVPGP